MACGVAGDWSSVVVVRRRRVRGLSRRRSRVRVPSLPSFDCPQARTCAPGAWTDSNMQGRPIGELLDVAVERSTLDQLEVEVGRTLEDRIRSILARDHGEDAHLDAVDQAG